MCCQHKQRSCSGNGYDLGTPLRLCVECLVLQCISQHFQCYLSGNCYDSVMFSRLLCWMLGSVMVSSAISTFIFWKWVRLRDTFQTFVLNSWFCYGFLNSLNDHCLEIASTFKRLRTFASNASFCDGFQHSRLLLSGNGDDTGMHVRPLRWMFGCAMVFRAVNILLPKRQ